MLNKAALFLLCFLALIYSSSAQLTVDNNAPNNNVISLVQNVLLGGGVTAFNISMTGDNSKQIGYFDGTNSNIGITRGIIMSSGDVNYASGPNDCDGGLGCSPASVCNNNGDPDLDIISGAFGSNTFDACIIEFDFVPVGDSVRFNYVFASEEYPQYVDAINDVFGFFLSGPGIAGGQGFVNDAINIALVPGTTIPITINNVNDGQQPNPPCNDPGPDSGAGCTSNCTFYVNNCTGNTVQFNGFTTVLTAVAQVSCGDTFHIKMAISDFSDQILDSGVFLEAESFYSPPVSVNIKTVSADSTVVEGCTYAQFEFTRPVDTNLIEIGFLLAGNAINGVDYDLIDTFITMGIGVDTAYLIINPIADGLNEGRDTVILTVFNTTECGDTIPETAIIFILDEYSMSTTCTDIPGVCVGTTSALTATGSGGNTPYTYLWSTSETTQTIGVTPGATQQFQVTIMDDKGCLGLDTADVLIFQLPTVDVGTVTDVCQGVVSQIGGNPTGPAGSSFLWAPAGLVSNATIANPTISPPGNTTFTVTVTDLNLCVNTGTLDVIINALPTADAGATRNICPGDITALGGTPTGPAGSTYVWDPPGSLNDPNLSNPNASPTSNTTYSVTITDVNGCLDDATVLVNVDPAVTITMGTTQSICPGDQAALFAAGGVAYDWGPNDGSLSSLSGTNVTATPAATTTYTVTVTNAGGCTNTESVTVTVFDANSVNPGADRSICLGQSSTLGGAPTAIAGSSYLWAPNSFINNNTDANPIVNPPSSTNYTVTVTFPSGCSAITAVSVTVNSLPTADAGTDQPICNGKSLTIGGAPTGPGPGFIWLPNTDLSSNTVANPVASPTANVTYSVTVTDVNGCTAISNISVTVNSLPTADAGTAGPICNGQTIQLNGTATGGLTAYSFSWQPTGNLDNALIANPNASPGTITNYTVTVTDQNGCTDIDVVTLDVNPLPNVNTGGNQAICLNLSVQIGGAPTGPLGSGFSWNNGGSLNNNAIANPVASPVATTVYTVTVTDINTCVSTGSLTVTVNSLPTADAGVATTDICLNKSVQIGGTPTGPGPGFAWSPGTGLSSISIANPTAAPVINTTYTVTVTDVNGCTDTDQIIVNVNSLPAADAGVNTSICIFDNLQLNATGGINYLWSPSDSISNINIANPIVNPIAPTTYVVTVTDVNGCTAIDDIVISIDQLPVLVSSPDMWLCPGDSIQITSSGGVSYSWTPIGNIIDPLVPDPIVLPTDTETYIVQVTGANSCINFDTVIVIVNPDVPTYAGLNDTICEGDTIQLGANPTAPDRTQYNWSPFADMDDPSASNPSVWPSTTTIFIVTTTNFVCIGGDTVEIVVNSQPNISLGPDVQICIGDTADLLASNGTIYLWEPAGTLTDPNIANPRAFPLDTTTYIVSVTDGNGCFGMDSIVVIVNPIPNINAGPDLEYCENDSVQIIAMGGTVYIWTPTTGLSNAGIADPFASPSDTTQYIVMSTDSNGCVNSDTMIVVFNLLPIAEAGSYPSVCIGNNVQITATGGDTYLWSPNISITDVNIADPIVSPSTTQQYNVIVTDTNGCSAIDSTVIVINPVPTLTVSTDKEICLGQSQQLGVIGASSYEWNPGTTLNDSLIQDPIATPAITTNYFVSGTDLNGCINIDSVLVTVHSLPTSDAGPDELICVSESVQIGGTPTATDPIFDILWNNSSLLDDDTLANPTAINLLNNTTFTVQVTDTNNCSSTDTMTIFVYAISAISDTSTCANEGIRLSVQTINGQAPFSYLWRPGETLDDSTLASVIASPADYIEYRVSVTDASGCVEAINISITVNVIPITKVAAVTLTPTCDGLDVQFSNETDPETNYAWDFGDGTSFEGDEPIHLFTYLKTHEVIVVSSDRNNCSDTVKLEVNAKSFDEEVNQDITNIFTPNGDGINEIFEVSRNNQSVSKCSTLRVYNRWGSLIYETKDVDAGWNGRNFSGIVVPGGTYYYVYDINGFKQSAYITLIR